MSSLPVPSKDIARSNCLVWAWRQWKKYGGGFVIWKSHYGWWWHFGHKREDGTIHYFYPEEKPRKRWFPPPLFKGHVVQGDYDNHKPEC
jgi:hypothetical protein